MCAHVFKSMSNPAVNANSLPQSPHPPVYFLRPSVRVSYWTYRPLIWLTWLSTKPQRSSCLLPQHGDWRHMWPCPAVYMNAGGSNWGHQTHKASTLTNGASISPYPTFSFSNKGRECLQDETDTMWYHTVPLAAFQQSSCYRYPWFTMRLRSNKLTLLKIPSASVFISPNLE